MRVLNESIARQANREDSDFTSIQERLRTFTAARQSAETEPADPIPELLPFTGGEHINAPGALPSACQITYNWWTGLAGPSGMGASRQFYKPCRAEQGAIP